jgi:hypothetical protein
MSGMMTNPPPKDRAPTLSATQAMASQPEPIAIGAASAGNARPGAR